MAFGRRVGFFLKHAFHAPMLRPVYDRLAPRADCLLTRDYRAMLDFRPDILLLAEHHNAFFRPELPETLIVSTTHGFGASKNYTGESMPWFDIVCLPSPWLRDYCVQRGWLPRLDFWVTGFTGLDDVLAAQPSEPPAAIAALRPGRVMLFAPTYTPDLTALEVLGEQWLDELCSQFGDLGIVVKLHPHTAERFPEWLECYRRLADASPRVVLVEDCASNVHELLPFVDVLLTDVSSVALNFLYFDRPMILVDHPRREHSPKYEPNGLVWRWRDMGRAIDSRGDLAAAVEQALRDPDLQGDARRRYRALRFGELADGRAADRVAGGLMSLIEPPAGGEDYARALRHAMLALARQDRRIFQLEDELYAREPGHYDVRLSYRP